VPALEVAGKPLNDSTIMNEFLDESHPGTAKLLPEDPYDKAIARQVIDQVNKVVVPAFFRLLQAQEPEKQAIELANLNKVLVEVSRKVKGPYFFGENFSLVDAAIAPWAVRDFIVRDYRGFVREAVPEWKDWAEALKNRKSVVGTSSVSLSWISVCLNF
jgi:glutathione S-transferase